MTTNATPVADPVGIFAAGTLLGTATIENRTPYARRVMQACTLPLLDGELSPGDPVTATDTGTGQPEACQVESWALPYPSGCERVVRVVFPAELAAGDLRKVVTFYQAATSTSAFIVPPNVAKAIANAQFAFSVGPVSRYVPWTVADVTEALLQGTRTAGFRFFKRLPGTQWWCELDIELQSGQDYAVGHFRFGYCDPRLDDDGEDRWMLSDVDTEIALHMTGGSEHAMIPVPLYRDHSTRSLQWGSGRWSWVLDRRTIGQFGGPVNNFLPWGLMGSAKFLLLFGHPNDFVGIRHESQAAWITGGELPFSQAISNDWPRKESAFGPCGVVQPRPKRHQHWDRTRDAEFVRTKLEVEAVTVYAAKSPIAGGNLWTSHHGMRSQVWGNVQGDSPGTHASWGNQPHYAAIAYGVPGFAHASERGTYACPWPYFYREADGRIVSAFDHPDLVCDRGAPGRVGSFGDMLGKSRLQRWRGAGGLNFTIRYERTGEAYQGADPAHFECAGVASHHVIFGDRGTRRIAEHIAQMVAGTWGTSEVQRGSTGQSRGFMRGMRAASWLCWALGDERLLGHFTGLLDHRYDVAKAREDARFPGRVIRTVAIHEANPNAGNDRVELRRHRYWRPWEDGLGVDGALGLSCLMAGRYPDHAHRFRTLAQDITQDVLRHGMPRLVDETTGRVLHTATVPYNAAIAAAFLEGARQLTPAEIDDNNFARCGGMSQCAESGEGYLKIESGSASFCWGAFWWVLGGEGAAGNAGLARYVPEHVKGYDPRAERPNDYMHTSWLQAWSRYGGIGHQDRITLGDFKVLPDGTPLLTQLAVILEPSANLILDLPVASWAVDASGTLLAVCDGAGQVDLYGRGPGGAWGVPRLRVGMVGVVRVGFTAHERDDDGQRLVLQLVDGRLMGAEV